MRVGILGVGRMGRRHIPAVQSLGHDVVAVFDPNPSSLEAARVEQSVPDEALFNDRNAFYDDGKLDVVIVATTADSHCELVCEAAERGAKYVLVEKPMATSIADCDRMIEACARTGAKLAVNHQMRFMEQYTVLKELFAKPEYGGFASMTVVAGNFGFAMNGSHYFEAFRFLTDETPQEINAWFSPEAVPNPRGPQFLDRAGEVRAVTPSGKRLNMEIGADQGHGVRVIYACRNGMIVVDELTGRLSSSVREEQYRELPTTRYGMPSIDTDRSIKPADVIDSSAAVLSALLTGTNSVTGEVGRQTVSSLVAAYQSAERRGAAVAVAEADPTRVFPWA